MASFGFATNLGTRITAPRIVSPKRISAEPCRLRRRLVVRQAKADKDEVFKRTKDVIVKQLDVKEVEPQTTFADLASDSLDIVEVMMALEEEFEIQFDDEDSAKVSNVGEAVDLITTAIDKQK